MREPAARIKNSTQETLGAACEKLKWLSGINNDDHHQSRQSRDPHQSRQRESWQSHGCRMENHRSHYHKTTDWCGLGKESCSCSCCIQCYRSSQRNGTGWGGSYDCSYYKHKVWNNRRSNCPIRAAGSNSSYCCSFGHSRHRTLCSHSRGSHRCRMKSASKRR